MSPLENLHVEAKVILKLKLKEVTKQNLEFLLDFLKQQ